VDRSSGLRRIVRSSAVQGLIKTARAASVVSDPLRFTLLESANSGARRHRLRGSEYSAVVRHGTRDIDVLKEIFASGAVGHCYDPPSSLVPVLERGEPLQVIDAGGNIGLFGLYVLSRWRVERVVSVEPDPDNAGLLRHTIRINDLADRWQVVEAAAGVANGHAHFNAGLFADSHLGTGGDWTVIVRVIDLFALDHAVDLLKLDIEGGEWPILFDGRLSTLQAGAVVLEWHGQRSPERPPRDAAVRRLETAGYTAFADGPYDPRADVGVLWAWRAQ
jgi:FkbM family methyltransferase